MITRPVRNYEVGLRTISTAVVCVFLIASETPCFAVETDRAAVAIERREGVIIGGGDGSSFNTAIIVHATRLPRALLAGFEYIALRYGWIQISSGSIVHKKGKTYKVVTYQDHTAMGEPKPKRVFYFDVTEYAPTHSVPPEYPHDARDKGLTGKGVALLKVDPATGHVTSVSMIKSTGHDILDNAAVHAFWQWRYRAGGITTSENSIQFTTKGVIY